MKTQKSVEGNASGPSNKKVVKKLVLNRETIRSMGVRTGVRTGISIVVATTAPCHDDSFISLVWDPNMM